MIEFSLLLVAIALICVALAANPRQRRSPRNSQPTTPHPKPVENVSAEVAPPKPAVFNKKTAIPSSSQLSIHGAAYVIDGDSIVIQKQQIRLHGIDAPELNHPHGQRAKWALVGMCKGQIVCADIIETDAHGRSVARCFLPDGRDLSAEMVKLGLAIDWPKFSGGRYTQYEVVDARKKMWLADARQRGHMHVWEKFDARQRAGAGK